jgi:hypothetical protein
MCYTFTCLNQIVCSQNIVVPIPTYCVTFYQAWSMSMCVVIKAVTTAEHFVQMYTQNFGNNLNILIC